MHHMPVHEATEVAQSGSDVVHRAAGSAAKGGILGVLAKASTSGRDRVGVVKQEKCH